MNKTLEEIADRLGGRLEGDPRLVVSGLAGLLEARPGELSFVADPRYEKLAASTRASALVIGLEAAAPHLPHVRVARPELAFDALLEWFRPAREELTPGVDPRAHVEAGALLGEGVAVLPGAVVRGGARIGERCVLHPGSYVGPHATLGSDCVLHPNAVVREHVTLGARVIVHSGAVIGADGFGYQPTPQGAKKLEHVGTVEIGDDVEIGANATIDRARFGRTVLGAGTKIDNLVQIAHNVQVGRHVLIAAQAGVSGSTAIGDGSIIGGQAGLTGHIRVGRGVKAAARAGISKDTEDGAVLYGYVAAPHLEKKREEAALRKLPDLLRRVRELERRFSAGGEHD